MWRQQVHTTRREECLKPKTSGTKDQTWTWTVVFCWWVILLFYCLCSPCSQPNEGDVRKYTWIYPICSNFRECRLMDPDSLKHAGNSNSIHFPVDTSPSWYTWWWSHDSYTRGDVSCNGYISRALVFIPAILPYSMIYATQQQDIKDHTMYCSLCINTTSMHVYLFVPIASISSMNTIEGECSSATRKSSLTSFGPSPLVIHVEKPWCY